MVSNSVLSSLSQAGWQKSLQSLEERKETADAACLKLASYYKSCF